MARQWYLVGYDVCDSKRLRRTAKLLEGYGYRIQYSFFRVLANERQIERLRWELSQILTPEDHLLIIGLCPKCAENVEEQSATIRWEPSPPNFQILGGHFKGDYAVH
ncbi:CRISPR-associated endonuclease Cas2 [bacterium]|nr:CRISPR-associated endonuclease Cas2 [bacterium]